MNLTLENFMEKKYYWRVKPKVLESLNFLNWAKKKKTPKESLESAERIFQTSPIIIRQNQFYFIYLFQFSPHIFFFLFIKWFYSYWGEAKKSSSLRSLCMRWCDAMNDVCQTNARANPVEYRHTQHTHTWSTSSLSDYLSLNWSSWSWARFAFIFITSNKEYRENIDDKKWNVIMVINKLQLYNVIWNLWKRKQNITEKWRIKLLCVWNWQKKKNIIKMILCFI